MKKRSIKFLAIVMALVCALCAINITAYADTTSSSKLDKPKVSISVSSTKTPTLKLSWDKVEGANKYYIYRADTKGSKLKLVAKTSKLYYKDDSVVKNKTYYYKVRAYKITNNKVVKKSDTSSTVSKAIVTLSKVKTLKATTVSESKIKLSWNKVSGATRYYMYYSTSKNGTYKSIGYTTKTSYTFSNLDSSTTYYFKVKSAKKLESKVYKSSYSSVASAKTNSKDGEFIVDFEKISNKEAGLPTGSAITSLTMLLNHYGLDLSPMEVYEYFDCSTEFYTKNGRLYGPNHRKYFIGDPTSNKAYCYGAEMVYIGDVYKEILATNKNTIKRVQFNVIEYDKIKKAIREGNIFFVCAAKNDPNKKCIFWLHEDGAAQMYDNQKYGILCGYTDTHYIVYDPYLDKYEKYEITFEYNVFTSFFAIANE